MNWEKRQGNCNQRANIINRLVFLFQIALQFLFKKEKKNSDACILQTLHLPSIDLITSTITPQVK